MKNEQLFYGSTGEKIASKVVDRIGYTLYRKGDAGCIVKRFSRMRMGFCYSWYEALEIYMEN